MSHSKEWKERREKHIYERMRNALERLREVGVEAQQVDKFTLQFMHKCQIVRYYPYTGGVVGASVKPTRGIDALCEQVKRI